MATAATADLLVTGADLLATQDAQLGEIPGGWVAVTDGVVSGIGRPGTEPAARETIDVPDCLVTPGLVNTHHHLYQNLTRAYAPALQGGLFDWLKTLYPIWSRLDEDAAYISAWIGLAELALGGCTTSMDHLYVHPRGGGDLISAEIRAARDVGLRFHATRGSMSLSEKDGGLPPDSVVQDDEEILADSARLVAAHHETGPHPMVQVALAPCSPFSVTQGLMEQTATLAEQLGVRLHTHIAETRDEDDYCAEVFGCRPIEYLDRVGWATERAWVAHCVYPNEHEMQLLGDRGVGVAHCPSSNMISGAGLAPVPELRAAGVQVGIGCDGSSNTDSASLWMETRNAMLLGRVRRGTASMNARDALDVATRGGAACLGRAGEIGTLAVGAAGDLVAWPRRGVLFAGALSDPIEAWLRCGPVAADLTVVAGKVVVRDGRLQLPDLEDMLAHHREVAIRMQAP